MPLSRHFKSYPEPSEIRHDKIRRIYRLQVRIVIKPSLRENKYSRRRAVNKARPGDGFLRV